MLIDLRHCKLPSHLTADVLIVGAGAVGLSMAVDLARAGSDVIVLEAGSTNVERSSQEFFETASWHGYPLEGLHAGRLRALGGTTNAWPGQLVPFDPIVFEHRPWVADVDWPIDRADLDVFYKRAFRLLGLEETLEDEEVWRQLRLAVPAVGDGLEVFLTRWTPEPRFAELFRDQIANHPKLRALVNAPVTGLSLGDDGSTVKSVTVYRDDASTQTIFARDIVLANGTIEIARLLSMPLSNGMPAPWSENPWVGRGFTDHVDAYAGEVTPIDSARFHATFDNILLKGLKYSPRIKLTESAQRQDELLGIAAGFLFNSQYKEDLDRLKALMKPILRGKINKSLLAVPARALPVARIAVPAATRYLLHRRSYNRADGGIQLRLSCEQKPLIDSRLKLRRDCDAIGMPLVDVDWLMDGTELDTMAQFSEMIADALQRERLARVELNPLLVARDPAFLEGIDDGNHQMGMARMASAQSQGVVDKNLRVFGSENLYVAGAATFPTTGFANPTFTAITLGLRLADHLTSASRFRVHESVMVGGAL